MAPRANINKATPPPNTVQVTMDRTNIPPTPDQALWVVIRNSANALGYQNYASFIDPIMAGRGGKALALQTPRAKKEFNRINQRVQLTFQDAEPYRLLKVATEVFMMANAGVSIGPGNQPLKRKVLQPGGEDYATDLEDANFPGIDMYDEELRILQSFTSTDLKNEWSSYLQPLTTSAAQTIETIPYLYDIVQFKLNGVPIRPGNEAYAASSAFYGILQKKLTRPCLLELLWNYWLEEGMLVQTTNAMSWRFQNRRGPQDRDPLAMVEIDPLRGLNNLLWGWVQDEEHRLTIPRRAYEYDHEYGLKLLGKAVPTIHGADSRSRFLEAFHTLLMLCTVFYKEDDDTTVVADGFPVLNALIDVHLLLSQGAHNQYGDLPWTARQEYLMQQWILARPEMREFLPRRIMVDYPEPWMDSVETMKTLQGWTDTSILHFRNLAIFGEQVLLSVRFGEWTSEIYPEYAANWARYWRPEIQGYIYAYRAATGVDLAAATVTGQVSSTIPAVLLRQRLRKEALADGAVTAVSQDGARAVGGRAARTRAIGSRTTGARAIEGRASGARASRGRASTDRPRSAN